MISAGYSLCLGSESEAVLELSPAREGEEDWTGSGQHCREGRRGGERESESE